MPRQPIIPHQLIVDFILAGHSTAEAKEHFGFKSDNVANLRVHAAFKRLDIKRPQYQEPRVCHFCKSAFTARNIKQRTCGKPGCQARLIRDWQDSNPTKKAAALARYRRSKKGRENNLRMHASRRQRGAAGNIVDRWNYAVDGARKRLRKLKSISTRSPWEYRLQHVQKLSGIRRTFNPRNSRPASGIGPEAWQVGLRAVQTTISQLTSRQAYSKWETAINQIAAAVRSGHRIRTWNRKNRQAPSL